MQQHEERGGGSGAFTLKTFGLVLLLLGLFLLQVGSSLNPKRGSP